MLQGSKRAKQGLSDLTQSQLEETYPGHVFLDATVFYPTKRHHIRPGGSGKSEGYISL